MSSQTHPPATAADVPEMTLFLCGDVMCGRGIDQVLPHPGDPRLHEPYMRSAKGYVQLAEQVNGRIESPVDFTYIWGDALAELRHRRPDVRIINLETAVTASSDFWPGKGIHYRMHPANLPCLSAAAIDCCVLANNHVLDWGYRGLLDTLDRLAEAGIRIAGAGRDRAEAEAPAVIPVASKGRVIVLGIGDETSGIPHRWRAGSDRPGVNLLLDLDEAATDRIGAQIAAVRQPGDVVVASIHWGGNWGYAIPAEQRRFAQRLIDRAKVDIVHGHSSHHPKGIEVHSGKLILYGCGDFLNDYEGIAGYEEFRGDLSLMYFATVNKATGTLVKLSMTAMQIRRFRLNRARPADVRWLHHVLQRESRLLGTAVQPLDDAHPAISIMQ